jgi:hypothetical protein
VSGRGHYDLVLEHHGLAAIRRRERELEAYLRWGILTRARALRRVRCPRQGPSDGLPFALISQSMIAEGSGDSDSGRAAPLRGAGLAT